LRADVAGVIDEGTIVENRVAHVDIGEAAADQAASGQARVLQARPAELHVAQHAGREHRTREIDIREIAIRQVGVPDDAARFQFHCPILPDPAWLGRGVYGTYQEQFSGRPRAGFLPGWGAPRVDYPLPGTLCPGTRNIGGSCPLIR
jgi:hypothetical protein